MKTLFSFAFILLSSAAVFAGPSDSAVHIRRDGKDGWNAGSGTVIACENDKSLILSAAHVVPDQGKKLTVTHNGTAYDAKYLSGSKVTEVKLPDGKWTLTIDGSDLVLLTVDAKLPAALLAKNPVKKGDRIRQFGFSGGRLENGPFEKLGVVTDDEAVWSTADSRRGDSGCALFNCDGDIVGVVHSRPADEDEPAGLAIGLVEVKDFLKAKVKGFDAFQKTLK